MVVWQSSCRFGFKIVPNNHKNFIYTDETSFGLCGFQWSQFCFGSNPTVSDQDYPKQRWNKICCEGEVVVDCVALSSEEVRMDFLALNRRLLQSDTSNFSWRIRKTVSEDCVVCCTSYMVQGKRACQVFHTFTFTGHSPLLHKSKVVCSCCDCLRSFQFHFSLMKILAADLSINLIARQ